MQRASHAEISMRHFPDLSDASFQIPTAQDDMLTEGRPDDLELPYDAFEENELGDLDVDPFTTPMPKSKHHAPLTLSEITPRGERTDDHAVNADISSLSKGAAECSKQKQSSVRPVLPKKESVDDMFERRKRDNYQQMGIDLTSRSTARLRGQPDDSVTTKETQMEPAIKNAFGSATVVSNPQPPRRATDDSKSKKKRPVLREHARVAKHNPRMPSSSSAQNTRLKSILKPSKPATTLHPSTLSRTVTALSKTPKNERPKWGDVVAEVQQTSRGKENRGSAVIGGGLIDVLVMYGEKLKNSIGFSSSGNTPTISSNISQILPPENSHHALQNPIGNLNDHPHDMGGPSSKPLTLSDLTPSRSGNRRQKEPLRLSELSPSRQTPVPSEIYEESDLDEAPCMETSPMRQSKKRPSASSPRGEGKKGRTTSQPLSQIPESSKAALERDRPVLKALPKLKVLGPSLATNDVHRNAKPVRPQVQSSSKSTVPAPTKPRLAVVSSRDLKTKRIEVHSAKPHSKRGADKEQHMPVPTVPLGPAFASDVYRQRALEKLQAEREKKEEQEIQKRSFKAGAMPHFRKPAPPARPAVRTTVPAAFTFQSDARATQRNAEFEEKRKTWESRVTRHALPMPDFAAIHAAQAVAARSRRAVPVLPTEAPALTTMVRAKEREKFEEERRARERAIEKLRKARERERAEQEEKAYKEARKRTVPKAHDVPDWYKDVPKRKEME